MASARQRRGPCTRRRFVRAERRRAPSAPSLTRGSPGPPAIHGHHAGAVSEELEAIAGATFVVANAVDPAFSNGLGLGAAADTLRLLDATGDEVVVFAHGCDGCPAPAADRSLTRVPDLVGDLDEHPEAALSPGTLADGTPFSE